MSLDIPAPRVEIEVRSADHAALRVRRQGRMDAATRLVLSHGNGFAIDGYFEFWQRFLGDFDVVVFDMRSHGKNPPGDPDHHDYAHMVQDIDAVGRAIRDEFGGKPTVGIFHSMSAQSALLQTMAGAGHFDALVLFDPPNVPAPGHPVHQAMVRYEHKLARWASNRRDRFDDRAELAA
jgi:pimeloyl-ACP methyl ester carboxylesterase